MNWVTWAFSGIGSGLILFLLGLLVRDKRKRVAVEQKQKAGDGANQVQSGRDTKIE